jgi:hypothetical protein
MASKSVKKAKGPEIKLIESDANAAALKNMYERKAELIYGKDRTFNAIKDAKKPFIVWLYGPPGSGKSSPVAQKIIHEDLGLHTNNAVSISLDALVEGLEPFQRKSANVYRTNREDKSSLAASLYTQAWQAKVNGDADKTLSKKRRELFQKAVEYELDIIYEFVVSGPKDALKEEIFDVLEKTGKLDTYNVYVVYPFVKEKTLEKRLAERPARQMASNTPFYRYVSPSTASTLTKAHLDYFVNYIIPRTEKKNLIGETPVISAYVSNKLKDGKTQEEIKSKLTEHKDLPGKLKKVVVFENKSTDSSSSSSSTRRRRKYFSSEKKSKTFKSLSK